MRLFKPLILALLMAFPALAQTIPSPQISLTGNIGCAGFPCLNNGILQLTLDANHTMTAIETSAFYIKVTSSVSLTATRNLIAPAGRFPFTIENATTGGQSIQIIGPSGTGVTIANGAMASVWNDGTNYVQSGSIGGAPGPPSGSYQYNCSSGAFCGNSGFTYNSASGGFNVLSLPLINQPGNCVGPYLTLYNVCQFNSYTYQNPGPRANEHSGYLGEYYGGTWDGAGWDVGNPSGVINNTGWYLSSAIVFQGSFFTRGIKNLFGWNYPGINCWAIGDCQIHNEQGINYDVGQADASGEAFQVYNIGATESGPNTVFTGTTTSTTVSTVTAQVAPGSSYSPAPTTNVVTVVASSTNNGHFVDGDSILDVTQDGAGGCGAWPFVSGTSVYYPGQACGAFTGTYSNFTACGATNAGQVPVTIAHGTINSITACGITQSNIGDTTNLQPANIPVAQTVTVTLGVGSGLSSFGTPTGGNTQTDFVCVAGQNFFETDRVYKVAAPSGGSQAITILARLPNITGSLITQGNCAPSQRLVVAADATYGAPSAYWVAGVYNGYLIYMSQGFGGTNHNSLFRADTPETDTGNFTVVNAAEITSNLSYTGSPITGQIEDDGFLPAVNDVLVVPPYPTGEMQLAKEEIRTNQYNNGTLGSYGRRLGYSGEFGNVGAITQNWVGTILSNDNPCTSYTYQECGGPFYSPQAASVIQGVHQNVFSVQAPGLKSDGSVPAVLQINPAQGSQNNQPFNLWEHYTTGYGESQYKIVPLAGDTIYNPNISGGGQYVSEGSCVGFQDFFNYGKGITLSDPSLGSTLYLGNTCGGTDHSYNLSLNSLTAGISGILAWSSDTGLSRDSAGVVDVGNGAAGNKSGTIALTTLTHLTGGLETWNSDTGLSRLSAANLALGNATGGDASGRLALGQINLGATSSGIPTASSCGGGTVQAGGNNNAFAVTGITAATTCTVTFSENISKGICPANAISSGVPIAISQSSNNSAFVTFTMAAAVTGSIFAVCF